MALCNLCIVFISWLVIENDSVFGLGFFMLFGDCVKLEIKGWYD